MFIKKLLLGGVASIFSFVPIVALASCSSGKEVFNIGIPEKQSNYYGKKIANLTKDQIKKTRLITAGGKVNDKSFNQSALGALKLFENQAKKAKLPSDYIDYHETVKNDDLPGAYDKALSENVKIWVLTGFQQAETFKQWLFTHKPAFVKSKAIIVGVDWDGTSFMPDGQFFGLGFKTQEASWVVGQAASEYLSTTTSPYLSSFGGGVFDGVTNFNNGFLQGMLDWNKDPENINKKVQFRSGNKTSDVINLKTGFEESTDASSTIQSILGVGEGSPQIILPVAGVLTTTTLQTIKSRKTSQLIIGVDSNQASAFPADKTKFFTSIEKNIGLAIYKAIIMLSGISLDFTDGNINDLEFKGEFISIDNGTPNSFFVEYGFDKGFVGYSPSTLSGKNATIVNVLLEKYYVKFNTAPLPIFKEMTVASANQRILDAIISEINK